MRRFSVLFLAKRYAPHIGGVETHLQKLSAELLKHGFTVTIITEQDKNTELLREYIDGVLVLRIPLPTGVTTKLAIWRGVWQCINYFLHADVIHIHDVFFWILPIYILLKILGKKIFITFHGYEGSQNPNFKQKFWHRFAALLSSKSIAIGGFHQKWYGVKPDIISYGAVAETLGKSTKAITTTGITKIIFVGRLSEDVGIMAYLMALVKLSNIEKVTLDVYGNGPQMDIARSFVAEHQLPVKFLGFVPHADIPWQKYHVAFVSRYLAVLEAFVAGLPVIAHYNVTIKRDYLLLSPFRNWICAAGAAEEIVYSWRKIKLDTWSKKIKSARAWARKQTWKCMTGNYLKLWGQ